MRDLLADSLVDGARRIALAQLERAVEARNRIGKRRAHEEALHDFRVSLRRLRSTLRAYHETFSDVPKKQHKQLKRIQRSTNEARDAHVQRSWLLEHRRELGHAGHRAVQQLLDHRHRGAGDIPRAIKKFDRALPALRRHLRAAPSNRQPAESQLRTVFRRELASLDRKAKTEFTHARNQEALHRARIVGKRIRYLVEPFSATRPAARFLTQAKTIQNILGEINDGFVLEGRLRRARRRHHASKKGLVQLAHLLQAERARDLERFRAARTPYLSALHRLLSEI
jgi:CHAD domain-containing protein